MNRSSLFRTVALLTSVALPASSALVTDMVLGSFGGGGSANITGDTASGANNADIYTSAGTTAAGNWGNELVYEFTLTESVLGTLTTNSTTGDPDFFLLNGLGTAPNGGKNDATDGLLSAFLDGIPPQSASLGLLLAGTYYLSADSFTGLDSDPPDPSLNATFDLTLSFAAFTQPSATDLGILGPAATAFTIDSLPSNFDTELALYSAAGNFLLTNDDAGGGVLQSELDLFAGLPAGNYFVALGGFNTVFGDAFQVQPGASAGNYGLNHPNGEESGTLASGEVAWFSFGIVPEPATTSLLALAGLGLLRRRRS